MDPPPALTSSYAQICNASTEVLPAQQPTPAVTITTTTTVPAPVGDDHDGRCCAWRVRTERRHDHCANHHAAEVRRGRPPPGAASPSTTTPRPPRPPPLRNTEGARASGDALPSFGLPSGCCCRLGASYACGSSWRLLVDVPPSCRPGRRRWSWPRWLVALLPMASQAGGGMTRAAFPGRRSLHPVAWWLWAAGLAVCAMRTNNPFLLALIGAVACFVVSVCPNSVPWSRSITFFLRVGVLVIVIRVVIEVLFGQRGVPGHVLFDLPQVPSAFLGDGGEHRWRLSRWSRSSMPLGGGDPDRGDPALLRCRELACQPLPAPALPAGRAVRDGSRHHGCAGLLHPNWSSPSVLVRQARRQRGIPVRGLRGLAWCRRPGPRECVGQVPAARDEHGCTRLRSAGSLGPGLTASDGQRRHDGGGLLLVAVGLYGVIDSGSLFGLGLPILAVAAVMCGDRSCTRRPTLGAIAYRPDPWRRPGVGGGRSGFAALGSHDRRGCGSTCRDSPCPFPPWPSRAFHCCPSSGS